MKRRLPLILIGILLGMHTAEALFPAEVAATEDPPRMGVTYTICAGFLVQVADKKLMIDVLTARRFLKRQSVPDRVVRQMDGATPPYDDVDIILATDAHLDHFDPDLVIQHMEANTKVELVCPRGETRPGGSGVALAQRLHGTGAYAVSGVDLR